MLKIKRAKRMLVFILSGTMVITSMTSSTLTADAAKATGNRYSYVAAEEFGEETVVADEKEETADENSGADFTDAEEEKVQAAVNREGSDPSSDVESTSEGSSQVVGSSEGSEAVNSSEGSEVEGSSEGSSEVVGSSEGSEVVGSSEGSEVVGSSEGSEAVDSSEGSGVEGSSEGSDVEGSSEGSEVVGSSEGSDVEGSSEGSEVVGSSEGSEVVGSSEGSDVEDSSEGSDVEGSSEGSDIESSGESESTSETSSDVTSEPSSEPETPKKEGLKIILTEDSFIYTGSAIKPEVVVTYNEEKLVEGVHYTVRYSNNVSAYTASSSENKMPKVIITGKGNWSGSVSKSFRIAPADINNVVVGGTSIDENGEELLTVIKGAKKSNPILYYGDIKVSNTNYTVIEKVGDGYKSKDTGKKITIRGKGNFTGERIVKANVIDQGKLKKFSVFLEPNELIFDGTDQRKNVEYEVYDKTDNHELKEGTDYIVSWSGNTVNAGKMKFTVIGLGLYSRTNITKSCTIKPIKADESEMVINGVKEYYKFINTGVTLDDIEVTYKGTILKNGKDYRVAYGNNKKAGIAKYTVSFMGNYKGSAAKRGTFVIEQAVFDESSEGLEVIIADKRYNGKPGVYKSTPYIILNGIALKPSDYTVYYYTDPELTEPVNNTNKIELWEDEDFATVYVEIETKGNSNYSGSIITEYQVRNDENIVDLSNAKVYISNKTVTYTGDACTNTLKVYCKKGNGWRRIYEDIDFKVTYANNVNKGKATVIITGIDGTRYTGAKTVSFQIAAQKVKLK